MVFSSKHNTRYTEKEKRILREISSYIYSHEKNGAKADSIIRLFGITDIKYISKYRSTWWNIFEKSHPLVYITLVRPGYFIGDKGELIDGITKFLQSIHPGIKIYLIENRINEYFINYSEVDNYCF